MNSQRVVLVACGCFNPITNMHLRLFELAKDALHKTGRYRVLAGLVSPASDHYKKAGLMSAQHRCAMIRLATSDSDWIRLDNWESQQNHWLRTAIVMKHITDMVQNANKLAMSGDQYSQSKRQKRAGEPCGEETGSNSPALNGIAHDPDSVEDWLQQIIRSDALTAGLDEENNDTESNRQSGIDVKLVCGSDLLESMGVPDLWKVEDMEYLVAEKGIVVINRPGSDARRFIYETDILSKHDGVLFPKENIHVVTEWMVSDVSATKVRRAIRRGESVKYILHDDVISYIRKHSLYLAPSAATTPCPEKKSSVRKQLSFDISTFSDELHEGEVPIPTSWSLGSSGYLSVKDPVATFPGADRVSRSVQTIMVSPEEQVVRLLKKCSRCGSRRLRFMLFDQSTPLQQSTGLEVVLKDLSLAHGETVL